MTPGTRKGRPATCSDCGDTTIAVQVPHLSWAVHLEDHDLPVTADLRALVRVYDAWEYSGPYIGWIEKYSTRRTWRPLRARHRCPQQQPDVRTPDRELGKHKHESEHST